MSNQHNAAQGNWFWPALFLVFLTLKLCDIIDWSWWWVTAPLWIPTVVFAVIAAIALGVMMWAMRDKE